MIEQKDWKKLTKSIDKLIKREYDKVNLAYENSVSFPYTGVSSRLHTLTVFLEDIKEKTDLWDDEAKGAFIKNLNASIDNINTIRNSIDTTWKSNDELYDTLKKAFDLLKEKKLKFDNKISSPPKKSDYERKYVDKETNETKIHYPGHDHALKIWKSVCNDLYKDCNIRKKDVESKLKEFKNDAVSAFNKLKTLDFSLLKSAIDLTDLVENDYISIDSDALKFLKNSGVSYVVVDESGKIITDNIENIDFSTGKYNIIVKTRQFKGNPYLDADVDVKGKLVTAGCGIISMSSNLINVLTKIKGSLVAVTPCDLARALNDFSVQNGGKGFIDFFTDGVGLTDFENPSKAISLMYDLPVFYNDSSFGITKEQLFNIIEVGGSASNSINGHIVATNYIDAEGKGIVVDTRREKKLNMLNVEGNYDFLWGSAILPSDAVTIDGDTLTIEGNVDIGAFSNVCIKGVSYPLKRVGNTNGGVNYKILKEE